MNYKCVYTQHVKLLLKPLIKAQFCGLWTDQSIFGECTDFIYYIFY